MKWKKLFKKCKKIVISPTYNKLNKIFSDQLNLLSAQVCPTKDCCITVWNGDAPVDGLTNEPCSNLVLYSSAHAIVAGCNVYAIVTTNVPIYASSECSLASQSFTPVSQKQTCSNSNVCVQDANGNTATAMNIGPSNSPTNHGCSTIGVCDCVSSSDCTYPDNLLSIKAFLIPISIQFYFPDKNTKIFPVFSLPATNPDVGSITLTNDAIVLTFTSGETIPTATFAGGAFLFTTPPSTARIRSTTIPAVTDSLFSISGNNVFLNGQGITFTNGDIVVFQVY